MTSLTSDVLLLERLDVLIDTTLEMIKTFATREERPLEQIRKYVAERHCSYLFASPDLNERRNLVQNILKSTSQNLEALCSTASIESFFLAVDPNDPDDGGFLGGSVAGREFWRGLRGGGSTGSKGFKAQCIRNAIADKATTSDVNRAPANTLKMEAYANVRNALRAASGIRNAEMKWKHQDQLGVYGVELVGWPSDVPKANPSTLSVNQNKRILESLAARTLKFISTAPVEESPPSAAESNFNGMDVYLRYDEAAAPAHQIPGTSLLVDNGSTSLTGPSPFSVSSERSTCIKEETRNKKRRIDDQK